MKMSVRSKEREKTVSMCEKVKIYFKKKGKIYMIR